MKRVFSLVVSALIVVLPLAAAPSAAAEDFAVTAPVPTLEELDAASTPPDKTSC